jgi:carbon-monoxide dehydrogenase medium subunit
MRPQGVAIAILNMAAWVKSDEDRRIENIRIACGPAGPKPFRAYQTEAVLKGKQFGEDTLKQASTALESEVNLRTSPYRATKAYRVQLLPILLRGVLEKAISRCN